MAKRWIVNGRQRLTWLGVGSIWSCALAHCSPDTPVAQAPALPALSAGTTATVLAGSSAAIVVQPPTAGVGANVGVVPSGSLDGVTPIASGAAGTPSAPAPVTTGATDSPLPCAVSKALATNCQNCHGSTPIGGAPMPLVTYGDFHKPALTKPTQQVFELSKARLRDTKTPMPPGNTIDAADTTILDSWLGAGALAGTEADKTCAPVTTPTTPTTTDGTFGPITALPGETCYDFKTHNSTTSVDATPYAVSVGEHYEQFYFKAPWPTGALATRYGTKLDNPKVLHHWLLFKTSELDPEGSHKTSPLPTLQGVNPELLAGWAVGGSNLALPDDVGSELPAQGAELNLQWHFYNSTGAPTTDASIVQVCTVPAGTRPHAASMTWLGQEDLGGNKWFGGMGMPAHQTSTYTSTCNPQRLGMNASDPIHVIMFWPHMHQLGTNMKTVVNRKGGMAETVFDKPFDFNHQVHFPVDILLNPGDTITPTCTFNNTTNAGVPFGESTDTEMCYQFTWSWPAHALENRAASLLGASNTCW